MTRLLLTTLALLMTTPVWGQGFDPAQDRDAFSMDA